MTTPPSRCARGPRCATFELAEQDGERPARLGAVCDRPLCDTCERALAQTLDQAPALYVQLRNATLIRGAAVRGEMVKASRGAPLPLNAQPMHLAEQLWWLLVTWEDEVRRIASASDRPRHGRREGRQVADAARFLGAHLTAWIAAPTTPFQVNTGHDPSSDAAIEQSGVEAACALLDWRATVRNVPGLDRKARPAVRRYTQPCTACGVRAVTHHAGDDLMQCQNCRATHPYLPTLPREADYKLQEAG